MSFCRDQHRHNYGGKKRCPFFHFFAHERKKTNDERPNDDQKSGLTHDLMISFFILTFAHSPETQSRGGRRQRRRRRRRRRERNNSALYSFIVLSHLLKQISSSLEVVVFYDSVKARTFFSSVAPKVTYSFVPFLETRHKKFNDNKNNNHYNNKR